MKILNNKCALKWIENDLTCHCVWDVELIKMLHFLKNGFKCMFSS
jgi:hypothetical protein